jgi:signal peptidase I
MGPRIVDDPSRHAVCCELVSESVQISGAASLKVTGCSMLPAVWPGDVITVEQCEFSALHPGQIVLHRKQQKLTVHRVTRVASDSLITRGDSLPCDDPPVQASEIVGRVVRVMRDGRVISLEQSFPQRITARLLRSSGVARRLTVAVVRRVRHAGDRMTPWFKLSILARRP